MIIVSPTKYFSMIAKHKIMMISTLYHYNFPEKFIYNWF